MAEPSERQATITAFKEIFNVNDEIAINALERQNWQLEAAIRVFLDGEDSHQQEDFNADEQRQDEEISQQNESQQNEMPVVQHQGSSFLGWLSDYALIPIRIAVWSLRFLFDFFYSLFSGPPLSVADPREEVSQFVREFRQKYDSQRTLPWLEMSYHSAVNEARRQIQCLLVYVHNPTHRRVDDFAQNYLLSPELNNFIRQNNCLIWGASIRSSEGYKVCSALHDFNYPFVALLCVVDSRATCIFRMSGEFTLRSLTDGLQNASVSARPMLDQMHARAAQREMDSQLRREQEADYQQALAADRARVRERKRLESEQIENQKREEELKRQEEQKLADWGTKRQEVLASLPNEPDLNEGDVVKVALRFPDGTKLERRFNSDDSLEILFNTAFSSQNCPKDFSLLSSYPRKELKCAPLWYHQFSSSDVFNDGPTQTFREAFDVPAVAVLVRDNEA